MARTAIREFATANPLYAGAAVDFWTVSGGVKTAVHATLYTAITGADEHPNPMTLDSDGMSDGPIYIEAPTIAEITGISAVTDHETGVIAGPVEFQVDAATAKLQFSQDGGSSWEDTGAYIFKDRGAWATATAYYRLDTFSSGGVFYVVAEDHTSGTFATDLAANKFKAVVDSTALAPLASPTFTGTPAAPTPAVGDADTSIATTEFVGKAHQRQSATLFAAGGTADAITGTVSPAITSYSAGMRFTTTPPGDNTITSPTLQLNGISGPKTIRKRDSSGAAVALALGDYNESGPFDFEYDGTYFILLNPLPSSVSSYNISVRQTALGGPVSATTGLPDFLPASATGLNLTTQNVSSSDPFVVASANGYSSVGTNDRVGYSAANLTWTGLTNGATNYLYVEVASDGSMTTGKTTTAPTYQEGGSYSTTADAHTFNVGAMVMKAGNGTTAEQKWRVFVGEAVTAGGNVTSTVQYGYRGRYHSAVQALPAANTKTDFAHNLGVVPNESGFCFRCTSADGNYAAGDVVTNWLEWPDGVAPRATSKPAAVTYKSMSYLRSDTATTGLNKSTPGSSHSVTTANWEMWAWARRGW